MCCAACDSIRAMSHSHTASVRSSRPTCRKSSPTSPSAATTRWRKSLDDSTIRISQSIKSASRLKRCMPPPSKYGRSDLLLATAHELGLREVFHAGGAAAVGAMAFGTKTIPAVDKIVGPGNTYVQLAKRALAGCVGIDGFLGPSEILVLADDTGRADFIAADLIAQAEHDPGSCFLLTTSKELAERVAQELSRQTATLGRAPAILKALRDSSAIIIDESMDELVALAN